MLGGELVAYRSDLPEETIEKTLSSNKSFGIAQPLVAPAIRATIAHALEQARSYLMNFA